MEGEPERNDDLEGEENESPEGLREDLNEKYGEHWRSREEGEKGGDGERRTDETGTTEHMEPSERQPEEEQQKDYGEPSGDEGQTKELAERTEEPDAQSEAEELREHLKEKYDPETEAAQKEVPDQEHTEDERDIENQTHASQEPAEANPESSEAEANLEPAGEADPGGERENDASDVENPEPPDPKEGWADEPDVKPAAASKVETEDGKEAPEDAPQTAADREVEASQPLGESRTEPPHDAQEERDEKVGIGQDASPETSQSTPEVTAEPRPVDAREQTGPPETSPEEGAEVNMSEAPKNGEIKPGESTNSFGESEVGERTNAVASEGVDRDGVEPSSVSAKSEAESTAITAGTDTSDHGKDIAFPIAEANGRESQLGGDNVNQELSAGDASRSHPEANTSESSHFDRKTEPHPEEPQVAHQPHGVENPSQHQNEFPASSRPERASVRAEHEPTQQPLDRQLGQQKEPPEAPERPLAVIPLKAYRVPGEREDIRFDFHTSSFEKSTGTRFEEGKVYRVGWGIDGVGDFEKVYRGQSDHFVLFVPREQSGKVTPGERYAIRVDSVEERRAFTVASENGHPELKITRANLESAGLEGKRAKEGRVAQLELRNLSTKEEEPTKVFATTEQANGRINLSLNRVGAREGDMIELLLAKSYGIDDFLKDFDRSKGREFENVRLDLNGSKLSMEVDGEKFAFREYRMSSYQLDAFLKTRLEHSSELSRLRYGDGRSARGGSGLYFRYSSIDDRFRVVHTVGKHQHEVAQLCLHWEGTAETLPERIDKRQILESLKLIGRPESTEGSYLFNVDKVLSDKIQSRLDFTRETSGYSHERGNIAEEVCATILEMDGWKEVRRHPFATRITGESNEHGPDSLMQRAVSENLALFEYKWWRDTNSAYKYAMYQTELYSSSERLYRNDSEIRGAYIAILDWREGSTLGGLHVKEVWSKVKT